jgi:hypothetical protein
MSHDQTLMEDIFIFCIPKFNIFVVFIKVLKILFLFYLFADHMFQPPELETNYYCKEDGLFPDLLNCAYFHKCTNGHSVHLKCETGSMFDAKTQTCNHKEAVTCYTGVSCPDATGLFPYPGDCYKFLNCFQGLPYVQSCPYRLVFDKILKRCVLSIHAICGE